MEERLMNYLGTTLDISQKELENLSTDILVLIKENYSLSKKKISDEVIFDKAMKIHNTKKVKGFIKGAKWMRSLIENN